MTVGQKVPVVLFGLGRMGANHFRVLRESLDFAIQAVVDPKLPADWETQGHGIAGFKSLEELEARGVKFDAAVVATPTEHHHATALELLNKKKHLLVEKPLASTPAQCDELISCAEKNNLVLAVGHVERYNPAVRKLREVIKNGWLGTPIHVSVTRVGGYPQSVAPGNNVLLDLAVHDIDVLRSLIGPLRVVSSVNHTTIRKDVYDTAEILLDTEEGVSASVHVNWITPTKIRTIRVTGTRGVCFVDYILQTCTMMGGNLLNQEPVLQSDFQSLIKQYQNSDKIDFGIKSEEPLKIQLRAFHMALNGDPSEICSGRDGAKAVDLVQEAMDVRREKGGHS